MVRLATQTASERNATISLFRPQRCDVLLVREGTRMGNERLSERACRVGAGAGVGAGGGVALEARPYTVPVLRA
jgi:hypothetical protein